MVYFQGASICVFLEPCRNRLNQRCRTAQALPDICCHNLHGFVGLIISFIPAGKAIPDHLDGACLG